MEDDYVTRILRGCIGRDDVDPKVREYLWHYVWANCPYLPHWSLPLIFDHDTDIAVTDWNNPTEFINWFGWHCSVAYIWLNHQLAHLGPQDEVLGLLTSNKPARMPNLFAGGQKVLDRNKRSLGQVVFNYLHGQKQWKQVTIEDVLYPTWGLYRMVQNVDSAIDRKTIEWVDLPRAKVEQQTMGRIFHIQETMIPKRVRHAGNMINRAGGGLT